MKLRTTFESRFRRRWRDGWTRRPAMALVEHLEGCAGCRTEVAELNAVWRGLETVKAGMDATPDAGAS